MNELQTAKNNLQRFARSAPPRKYIKRLGLDVSSLLLPKDSVRPQEFEADVSFIGAKLNVRTFATVPATLQRKYIEQYATSDPITAHVLARLRNHLVIEVSGQGSAELVWRNRKPRAQSVYIIVKGLEKLAIREERNTEDVWQRVRVVSTHTHVQYTLVNRQRRGFSFADYIGSTPEFFWQIGIRNAANQIIRLTSENRYRGGKGTQLVALRAEAQSRTVVDMLNRHQGIQTDGDMKFHGIGDDSSVTYTEGMIRVEPKASYTNSYLTQKILLMSDSAQAKTIPNLEILNNEVKASHGATVGRPNVQVMYYLETKGLSRDRVQELLIKAHLNEVIDKCEGDEVKTILRKLLLD